jgi:hypothetical protein
MLHKLCDYNERNIKERIFFNRLFNEGDALSDKDFYRKFAGLKDFLWAVTNQFTIFVPLPGIWGILAVCTGFSFILPLVLRMLTVSAYLGSTQILSSAFLLFILVGVVLAGFWVGERNKARARGEKLQWGNQEYFNIVKLFAASFAALSIALLVFYHPINFALFSAVYWICFVLMALLLLNIKKRTDYGNKMLGKILGFKHFLEVAEKDKLETLFANDPQYFYTILPYTYVLGVSNTWLNDAAKQHSAN